MTEFVYGDIIRKVYDIFLDGNQHKVSDLLPLVQKAGHFTNEQMREMTKGGNEPRIKKLVQWAVTHLYAAGLIDKVVRGRYVISVHNKRRLPSDDKELEKEVRRLGKERKTSLTTSISCMPLGNKQIKELLPKLSNENNRWMLDVLTMKEPDLETIKKGIRSLLVDAKDRISIEDLQELLKEAMAAKDILYELVLNMKNKGNKREPSIQVGFAIKDNQGNEYPFKLETRERAVYLTFLYMDKSVFLQDFCTEKEKPNSIFRKIYELLYNRKGSIKSMIWNPVEDEVEKLEAAKKILSSSTSKIRNIITSAVPNDSVARQFVIADNDDQLYTIQNTNEHIRDEIRKCFSLK